MQRFLLAIVVLLTALLLARDPHVEKMDGAFVDWLLKNSKPAGGQVPLTVIEIGREPLLTNAAEKPAENAAETFSRGAGGVSPLELALFLQSILDYKPIVVAIEPVVKWWERDKAQEQVFLDQAMRVPKLLLGAEVTSTPDPDVAAVVGASSRKLHRRPSARLLSEPRSTCKRHRRSAPERRRNSSPPSHRTSAWPCR